jgi:hypothetical protein
MTHAPPTTDALDVLRRLTPAEIERRIAEIDAERTALSTILRSIRARDRAIRRRQAQAEAAR